MKKTGKIIVMMALVALSFFASDAYAQGLSTQESDRMDSLRKSYEMERTLTQEARNDQKMNEMKDGKRETRAKAKEARRIEEEANYAARESNQALKTEKKAQRLRKKADKQAIKAEKARNKSDRN